MKNRNQIISLLLSLIMLFSIFTIIPVSVSAEEADTAETGLTAGDYTYELLENGTARIIRCNGTDAKLSIPSLLNGYTVTSIGDSSFSNSRGIEEVEIPDTVTEIGKYAFKLIFH